MDNLLGGKEQMGCRGESDPAKPGGVMCECTELCMFCKLHVCDGGVGRGEGASGNYRQ